MNSLAIYATFYQMRFNVNILLSILTFARCLCADHAEICYATSGGLIATVSIPNGSALSDLKPNPVQKLTDKKVLTELHAMMTHLGMHGKLDDFILHHISIAEDNSKIMSIQVIKRQTIPVHILRKDRGDLFMKTVYLPLTDPWLQNLNIASEEMQHEVAIHVNDMPNKIKQAICLDTVHIFNTFKLYVNGMHVFIDIDFANLNMGYININAPNLMDFGYRYYSMLSLTGKNMLIHLRKSLHMTIEWHEMPSDLQSMLDSEPFIQKYENLAWESSGYLLPDDSFREILRLLPNATLTPTVQNGSAINYSARAASIRLGSKRGSLSPETVDDFTAVQTTNDLADRISNHESPELV